MTNATIRAIHVIINLCGRIPPGSSEINTSKTDGIALTIKVKDRHVRLSFMNDGRDGVIFTDGDVMVSSKWKNSSTDDIVNFLNEV